jgi:hypothetical protein
MSVSAMVAGQGVGRGGGICEGGAVCSLNRAGHGPRVFGGDHGTVPGSRIGEFPIPSKPHLHSIHSPQNFESQRRYLERQKPTSETRGRMKGR